MRPYNPAAVAQNPNTLALAVYLGDAPASVKIAAIRHAYAPMASFVAALIAEAEGCDTVPVSSSFRCAVTRVTTH
jgi:hypothetical protein